MARQEELEALRAGLDEDMDYKALAESFFEQLGKLEETLIEREQTIDDLKFEVSNLRNALGWDDEMADAVEPDDEIPPSTVEEAVIAAMERYNDELVSGAAVNEMESVETLAANAAPPDKVLRYLRVLAEFTRARRGGALGKMAIKWLEDEGVIASPESDTIRNSPKDRAARTWDDGSGQRRYFDMHLKPSDATSQDRCVRIYFDYDEALGKTLVGWVGAHR